MLERLQLQTRQQINSLTPQVSTTPFTPTPPPPSAPHQLSPSPTGQASTHTMQKSITLTRPPPASLLLPSPAPTPPHHLPQPRGTKSPAFENNQMKTPIKDVTGTITALPAFFSDRHGQDKLKRKWRAATNAAVSTNDTTTPTLLDRKRRDDFFDKLSENSKINTIATALATMIAHSAEEAGLYLDDGTLIANIWSISELGSSVWAFMTKSCNIPDFWPFNSFIPDDCNSESSSSE